MNKTENSKSFFRDTWSETYYAVCMLLFLAAVISGHCDIYLRPPRDVDRVLHTSALQFCQMLSYVSFALSRMVPFPYEGCISNNNLDAAYFLFCILVVGVTYFSNQLFSLPFVCYYLYCCSTPKKQEKGIAAGSKHKKFKNGKEY